MTHAVVNADKIHAKAQPADVRPVVSSGCALDNGNLFYLSGKYSTSGSGMEVWSANVPATGSLTTLWMAFEPEQPFLMSGTNMYRGIGTIQDFYNPANRVFTAVKLIARDIFTITADGLTGSHSTGSYVVAVDGDPKWNWAALPAASAAYAQFVNTVSIPVPDGTIGTQRVTAYQFEVKSN